MSARHHLAIGPMPTAEEMAAIRRRLLGPAKAVNLAQQQPKAECLIKAPSRLINVGGRPRKQPPRPDADEQVRAFRLYMLQRKAHLTPVELVKLRCLEARIPYELMISHSRARHIVPVRDNIASELRTVRNLSFPQIGMILNRDHTSIMHSCKKSTKDG